MVEFAETTEGKILEAAKKVFLRKGFDGSRMQEIADEAGINKALLHYYFRSKDNLFDAVFKEAFHALFARIFATIESSMPIEEKVVRLFDDYITFVQKNPHIPSFILNAIQYNPERVMSMINSSPNPPAELFKRVQVSLEEAGIKNVDYRQLIVNIISLSVFPMLAKPMIMNLMGLTSGEFDAFIETRKKILPEFILQSIRS